MNDLRDELIKTKKALASIVNDRNQLKTKVQFLEKECKQKDSEINSLLQEFRHKCKENSKISSRFQLNVLKERINSYKNLIQEKSKENSFLLNSQNAIKNEEMRAHIANLESECQRLRAHIEKSVPESEYEQAIEQHLAIIRRLNEENVQMRKIIGEYEYRKIESERLLARVGGTEALVREFRQSSINSRKKAESYKNALQNLLKQNWPSNSSLQRITTDRSQRFIRSASLMDRRTHGSGNAYKSITSDGKKSQSIDTPEITRIFDTKRATTSLPKLSANENKTSSKNQIKKIKEPHQTTKQRSFEKVSCINNGHQNTTGGVQTKLPSIKERVDDLLNHDERRQYDRKMYQTTSSSDEDAEEKCNQPTTSEASSNHLLVEEKSAKTLLSDDHDSFFDDADASNEEETPKSANLHDTADNTCKNKIVKNDGLTKSHKRTEEVQTIKEKHPLLMTDNERYQTLNRTFKSHLLRQQMLNVRMEAIAYNGGQHS